MEISCRMGGCLNSADILSLESFGQLMLISQLLEDRVKARTEGPVNYRSACLGHGLLEKSRSVHLAVPSAQHCLFHILLLLSLGPWDAGIKAGCFSVRNHCSSQPWITWEPCQGQAEYSVRGGKKKKKTELVVCAVCMFDDKPEWFLQPGNTQRMLKGTETERS